LPPPFSDCNENDINEVLTEGGDDPHLIALPAAAVMRRFVAPRVAYPWRDFKALPAMDPGAAILFSLKVRMKTS